MDVVRFVGSVAGAVLVVVALYDMVATTVAVSVGKGPLAARVGRYVWQGFLGLLASMWMITPSDGAAG